MNPPLPRIGSHQLTGRAVLAPMAGVTDRPFRQLCRRLGAALAASEMVTSDVRLWQTPKTRRRLDHTDEVGPIVVQVAGGDATHRTGVRVQHLGRSEAREDLDA